MPIELYTLSDISKILGMKRERLSYWFARGFIKPSPKSKGRGKPPWFTRGDIYLIKLLGDMVGHGLSSMKAARYIEGFLEKLSWRDSFLKVAQHMLPQWIYGLPFVFSEVIGQRSPS